MNTPLKDTIEGFLAKGRGILKNTKETRRVAKEALAIRLQEMNPELSQEMSLNSVQDYSKVKFLFRELADMERGISWKVNEENNIIIRDARNADNPNGNYADYAVQMLNIGSAAFDLIDTTASEAEREGLKHSVTKELKTSLKELLSMDKKTTKKCKNKLKEANSKVLNVVKDVFPEYKLKEVNKLLGMAGNYAIFHDTHYSIATTYKIGEKSFVQLNEKISKKTDTQKEEYQNRKDKKWYQLLNVNEQRLIDHHIDAISGDNHLIGIQHRHLLGLRNAYKTTLMQKKGENWETCIEYIRSGCIPIDTLDTSEKDRLNPFNKEQLLRLAGNNKLNVISLNSGSMVNSEDSNIVKDSTMLFSEKSDIEKGISFVNIPINILRRVSTSNLNAVSRDVLNSYTGTLKEKNEGGKYNYVIEALESKNDLVNIKKIKAFKSIDKLGDTEEAKSFLKKILEFKSTLQQTTGLIGVFNRIFNRENYHAKLVAQYVNLNFGSEAIINNESKQIYAFSCKSGKDRTTSVATTTTFNAIREANPELDSKEIIKSIVYASGDQLLSSINAGTPGRFGTKFVSCATLPSDEIKKIQQPTSSYTDVIPFSSKFISKKQASSLVKEEKLETSSLTKENELFVKSEIKDLKMNGISLKCSANLQNSEVQKLADSVRGRGRG